MLRLLAYLVTLASPLLTMGTPASADEVFKATTAITLPSPTGACTTTPPGATCQKISSFDIGFVDPVIGLYVLADRTNKAIDVVDTRTNTVLTQLRANFVGATGNNDTSGPNGVLIVDHREAWAGDGPCLAAPCSPVGPSTVKVIELFSQQVTHVIPTGGTARADELCYDPRHHVVLIANDADSPPFVTFISTQTYTVLGSRITMDGGSGTGHGPKATAGIEQCQWNHRTGKFYLNLPEVNGPGDDSKPGAVLVIDPTSMQIEKIFTIPIASCAGPQGMALGPDHQILLGCNASKVSAIIDDRDGRIIKTLANEGGADEVWFNPGDDHYFLARSSATPNQQLGVVDADPPGGQPQEDQSLDIARPGPPNAHSVAADPILNQVYVPIPAGISTVCSSAGGLDAVGCIAVFTPVGKDDSRVAERDDHGRR